MRPVLHSPTRLPLGLLGLLGALAATPAYAQRVVPSAPIDSTKQILVVPRRDAALPPALSARIPTKPFRARLVGYRADSVVLRSFHWRGSDCPVTLGCPAGEDTLAIPVHAIDHLGVPYHSALAQRIESGGDGAFWTTILGAVVGSLLGGGDAALLGAGAGAVVGFVGGAMSPDPNHGGRDRRVTLRVVPDTGAREP